MLSDGALRLCVACMADGISRITAVGTQLKVMPLCTCDRAPQKSPSRKGAGMCAPFMEAVALAVDAPPSAAALLKLMRAVFSEFAVSALHLSRLQLSLFC